VERRENRGNRSWEIKDKDARRLNGRGKKGLRAGIICDKGGKTITTLSFVRPCRWLQEVKKGGESKRVVQNL